MSEENLFLLSQHPASRRFAVFEDDGVSAWLYLTAPESKKPSADAWVYNRIAAPPTKDISAYRGGPPPAAAGYASETAQCDSPHEFEWSFQWSDDGHSVAMRKNGRVVAFIVTDEKRRYSRELVKDGPWGRPWSDTVFQQAFR